MSLHCTLPAFLRSAGTAALLGFSLLATAPVHAEGYMGKVCLQGVITERENGPVADQQKFLVAYEVNHMGGAGYALSGNVNITGEPFIFTGYGNLIGKTLYMNISTTQSHADGWRDSGVMQVQLDMATMSGTFYENGRDFDTVSRRWDDRFTAGTVSRATCP